MDFRRSTLVLILSFLFLDIFLFGTFWQMKKEVKTPLNTSINVMEQMRNDGITVTGVNMTVESLPIIQISPISIEAPVNALPSQVVSYDKGVISSQLIFPIQLTLDANTTATMENFAELFAASEAQAEEFKKGNVIEGEVVQIDDERAYVSFGYKTEAQLERKEMAYPTPASAKDVLKEGDKIKAVILNHIKEDSPIYLSITRLAKDEDWQYVIEAQEKDEPIICKGVDAIPAGLVVTVKALRGFIPLSQGDIHFVKSLDNLVGTEFEAKVLEVEEKKNRLVLSRREVLEVERQAKLKEALANVEVGGTYKGTVRKIMPYGAFVDIGGIEGLLHISDISWQKIKRVEDVLAVGQEIDVKLQSFDEENSKISLSLKALSKSPWDVAEETIHVGDVVTGKVVRTVQYGAFVAINDDIQGLLHISQVTKQRNAKVEDYLSRGQEVEVEVISFNKDEKKLGLKLTELMEPVATEEEAE